MPRTFSSREELAKDKLLNAKGYTKTKNLKLFISQTKKFMRIIKEAQLACSDFKMFISLGLQF